MDRVLARRCSAKTRKYSVSDAHLDDFSYRRSPTFINVSDTVDYKFKTPGHLRLTVTWDLDNFINMKFHCTVD